MSPNKKPICANKPFPWFCRKCGHRAVHLGKIEYDAAVSSGGELILFKVKDLDIPICDDCGTKVFTEAVVDQINDAFTVLQGLGSPPSHHRKGSV